jgi:hypothetical protein
VTPSVLTTSPRYGVSARTAKKIGLFTIACSVDADEMCPESRSRVAAAVLSLDYAVFFWDVAGVTESAGKRPVPLKRLGEPSGQTVRASCCRPQSAALAIALQ